MVYNTDLCVAFKGEDGKYNISDISLFNLYKINEKNHNLKVTSNREGMCNIMVKCPLCGDVHIYKHSKKELLGDKTIFFGCKNYHTGIIIIGNREYILNHVYNYNFLNNELYALL